MPLDHQPLKHLLGYNIALAAVHTDRVFLEAIGAPLQLRQVEFTILLLIDANEEVTAKRLSAALALSAPNMSVVLDRLERRGLIKRVPSGADKRALLLQLTAKGRTLAAQAARISQDMEEHVLSRLTPAERAMLLELLEKVGGRAASVTAAAAPAPVERKPRRVAKSTRVS